MCLFIDDFFFLLLSQEQDFDPVVGVFAAAVGPVGWPQSSTVCTDPADAAVSCSLGQQRPATQPADACDRPFW